MTPSVFRYCLHSSLHQELSWFVISNTRPQHWRALHTQKLLVFWISDSALGCKTPLLTYYGFGAFQYTEEIFFSCESLQWFLRLIFLLWFHRHISPALHLGAHVCARVGVLMTQKFLLKTIMFIFPARQCLCDIFLL